MRTLILLGILLIALGGYVILQGLSFTSQRSVLRVGELEASLEEKQAVPGWVGGVVVVAGLALVVAGGRRGRERS
jgi:uncharacterized membrane protein